MHISAKRLRYAAFAVFFGSTAIASPRANASMLAQFSGLDDASAGWKRRDSSDGVTLEERMVRGSPFREYRAVVAVPIDPSRAADMVWNSLRDAGIDHLKRHDVIRQTADELVFYGQIPTPIIADRDFTVRIRRSPRSSAGRTELRCASANDLGPPPAKGHVRVPIIRAGWVIEPDPRGGTRLTHYFYGEPGGTIPAVFVRGAQADEVLAYVVRMTHKLLSNQSDPVRR